MATAVLITALLLFAVRGIFLGLNGVIARFLGFVGGYYMAYTYRTDLADAIASFPEVTVPDIFLQIASGLVLFFGTMALCSIAVSLLFKLLANIVPGFKKLLAHETTGGKVTGAVLNAGLGAAVALIAIAVFTAFTGKVDKNDQVQALAIQFGDTAFAIAENQSLVKIPSLNTALSKVELSGNAANHVNTNATDRNANDADSSGNSESRGSIVISSKTNPSMNRSIKIENSTSAKLNNTAITDELNLDTSTIKGLLGNSELKNLAQQQIAENPEKVKELLNNPKIQELLKSLGNSNNTSE